MLCVKIGIVIEGSHIAHWQAEALREIAAGNRFFVYACTNSRHKPRPFAHPVYYFMNIFAVRNPMTASVPVPRELQIDRQYEFAAESDGAWQRLPISLLKQIACDQPRLIIKFGMGLLRVPSSDQLACPILSYHHGDPRQFRGRPAAFYELLSGAQVIGQVVQILSNRLDAGSVVAFAETKAHPHSWRHSLIDAYRVSRAILPVAVRNAANGTTLPFERSGRNYRLPTNLTAMRLALKIAAAKLRRFIYGVLVEKIWEVAEAQLPSGWSLDQLDTLFAPEKWRVLPRPPRYRFFADPFFHPSGGEVILEAMRRGGVAEIVHSDGGAYSKLHIEGGHCSYPATFHFNGRDFLLPEISDWSAPRLFELTAAGVHDVGELKVPDRPRLIDPTIELYDGACYLFANRRDEGDRVLRLWVAETPFARFTEHPESPIRISPAGARMGGGILRYGNRLYRPGQDLRRAYGDGLLLFRVEELSHTAYQETEHMHLGFTNHHGPHTLNIRGTRALFDYYHDRVSPLAGLRRLRQSRGN
jgi:hypothetical protein